MESCWVPDPGLSMMEMKDWAPCSRNFSATGQTGHISVNPGMRVAIILRKKREVGAMGISDKQASHLLGNEKGVARQQ